MIVVSKNKAPVVYLCTPYHCHQLIHIIHCCKILILWGSEDEFRWILLFHTKIIFFLIIFRQRIAKILIHYVTIYCVDLDIFQTVTNTKIISHFMVIYLYTISFLPYSWDMYICNQGEQVTGKYDPRIGLVWISAAGCQELT